MRVRLSYLTAFLLLAATAVFAQATTGSISGTVTDETGAVMPGVTITVTNTATGVERVQVSDDRGRYRVLDREGYEWSFGSYRPGG